jgi:hypothetical protein
VNIFHKITAEKSIFLRLSPEHISVYTFTAEKLLFHLILRSKKEAGKQEQKENFF